MMRRTIAAVALGVCALAVAADGRAQTPEERASGREVIRKYGDAAIMVLATIKARVVVNGREQTRDLPMQANGLVIAASGLTIMPLSLLEPGDLIARTLSATQGPTAKVDVSSETSELRIRFGEGREVPATVALRDSDLDLVFVRPTEPLSAPVAAVDAPSGKPDALDSLLALQRGTESFGWRLFASFTFVQMAVDKPRPFYMAPAAELGGNGLGASVFDSAGRFVGLFVRLAGSRTAPLPAVLPAEDIRELAKQIK